MSWIAVLLGVAIEPVRAFLRIKLNKSLLGRTDNFFACL